MLHLLKIVALPLCGRLVKSHVDITPPKTFAEQTGRASGLPFEMALHSANFFNRSNQVVLLKSVSGRSIQSWRSHCFSDFSSPEALTALWNAASNNPHQALATSSSNRSYENCLAVMEKRFTCQSVCSKKSRGIMPSAVSKHCRSI